MPYRVIELSEAGCQPPLHVQLEEDLARAEKQGSKLVALTALPERGGKPPHLLAAYPRASEPPPAALRVRAI